VNGDETPMLQSYHNLMRLKREFRTSHPKSAL
jgi:hypothetical protein